MIYIYIILNVFKSIYLYFLNIYKYYLNKSKKK